LGLSLVVLGCVWGCAADRAAPAARLGSTGAPGVGAIRVVDLDGAPRDLWAGGSAPATVVVFTRTDCPVSNRFAPEIRGLYETYHPAGVEFYLVYVDPVEDAAAIRTHLSEYRYPCRAVRDPEHTLVAYCHATVTPEAVVFGADRSVAYRGRISDLYADVGNRRPAATKHDLAAAIDATVHGRPVATPRTKAVGCIIADLKR
jgi:hypothetical protein